VNIVSIILTGENGETILELDDDGNVYDEKGKLISSVNRNEVEIGGLTLRGNSNEVQMEEGQKKESKTDTGVPH